jgi:hypothetical protein
METMDKGMLPEDGQKRPGSLDEIVNFCAAEPGKNPKLDELIQERTQIKDRIKGKTVEAKQLIDKLQLAAGKLQIETTELSGALKYVEKKIVEAFNAKS